MMLNSNHDDCIALSIIIGLGSRLGVALQPINSHGLLHQRVW